MNENDELKKLLEKAMHSRNDPRFELSMAAPTDSIEINTRERPIKKRQCANCTCGRSKNNGCQDKKIDQSNTDSNKDKTSMPKGGCGSCNLGDAFRCSGCPYRGMPAFKKGEEFKFDDSLNDL